MDRSTDLPLSYGRDSKPLSSTDRFNPRDNRLGGWRFPISRLSRNQGSVHPYAARQDHTGGTVFKPQWAFRLRALGT